MNDALGFSYTNLDPSFMAYEYKIKKHLVDVITLLKTQQTQKRSEKFCCSLLQVSVASRGGQS